MLLAKLSELDYHVLMGGYRLRAPIGQGGSALVYEAECLRDGQTVAVKVLLERHAADPSARARLFEEAAIGRELPRTVVARTLDVGTLPDGSPYLVMERLEGESLAQLLLRTRALPWRQAAALGARLSRILHVIHTRALVHRDLKPEHVWLTRLADGSLDVRLLDFGVALRLSSSERVPSQGPSVFGTPGYLAPEQALSDAAVDARADLYALGIVLFEAVTGERPFKASNAAVTMRRTLEEDVPALQTRAALVPETFARLVSKLCRRDPDRRFSNARLAERALRGSDGLAALDAAERELARRVWRTDDLVPLPSTLKTGLPTLRAALH